MQLADVLAEHARIRARAARVARADAAVATHHHPGLRVKRSDVRLLHRMADYTGASVAHDLHVELDGTDLLLRADVGHRFELVVRMRAATDDGDVCWSTHVSQTTRNGDRIFVTTTGNQDANGRAPGVVRVAVGSDILTTRARLVDECDRLFRPAPNLERGELNV